MNTILVLSLIIVLYITTVTAASSSSSSPVIKATSKETKKEKVYSFKLGFPASRGLGLQLAGEGTRSKGPIKVYKAAISPLSSSLLLLSSSSQSSLSSGIHSSYLPW